MTFTASTFDNFIATESLIQQRLFPQYSGADTHFDVIIVGSGMGGGILADDLAETLEGKRILVVEAGSYLFPTHVYNLCRFPNAEVAGRFACRTFQDQGPQNGSLYIHERPQLNFGGRSIFWSGLIPEIQAWELDFFPPAVRADLVGGLLSLAGERMNQSRTLGTGAQAIVAALRASPIAADFKIAETPRALHQPYLTADGEPTGAYALEPTGVFNTAELLTNQVGQASGQGDDGRSLHLLLNAYVEDIRQRDGGGYEIVARDTRSSGSRVHFLTAETLVLAGGSIESPKLLQRSTLGRTLAPSVRALMGRGLTDHPTTSELATEVTAIGNVPIHPDTHAKIIFYSRGRRDAAGQTIFPFNVEMNVNHEYWHLRDDDPTDPAFPHDNTARVDIKFSFANCLDDGNAILAAPPFGYVPEIRFANLRWMDRLTGVRFPAVAGWTLDNRAVIARLNAVANDILGQFQRDGGPAWTPGDPHQWRGGDLFGLGTIHHAAGTLRMPARPSRDAPFAGNSVVDETLQVVGAPGLYVCDMSVMPLATAANPVRTLAALALRLSRHLGSR